MTDAPTLAELNEMTRVRFVGVLGEIFEMSPWIAEAAWDQRPFADRGTLLAAMVEIVEASGVAAQTDLLRAHPDLAGKAARVGALTASSTREQAGAGLDRMSDDQYERFHQSNTRYRERFGFPFIIAVKGHDAGSILTAFERRLTNNQDDERVEGLRQVGRIAEIRLESAVRD